MKESKILREYHMMIAGQKGLSVMAASEEEARAAIERKLSVKPYASVKLDAWRRAGKPVEAVGE